MAGLPPGNLFEIPSKAPPPGAVPNFTKRSPLLDFTIAVSAIVLPLMYTFLGIRIYMRLRRKERWMLDDSVAVATATACTVLSGLILATAQKLARHSWDVPLGVVIEATTQKVTTIMHPQDHFGNLIDLEQTMFAQHFFNSGSLWLGKMCMLTMYYRLFGHIRKTRWQLYGTGALTLPIFIAIILQPSLIAPPAGKPWGTPNPHVNNAVIPSLMVGIDNLLVDLLIAYIPIPILRRLNLTQSKKNGIIALFAMGFIAVLTDIVTLYFRIKLFEEVDQLLYGYICHNCALIESSISVVLSSLPSTASLWRVYIEPSQFYQSLRMRLTSSKGSEDGSAFRRELPEFKESAPVKKPRDPYSIGLPTTNFSQTHLSSDNGLDLTESKYGTVRAQISSELPNEAPTGGEICRKVSVEQSSVSYPDSDKLRTERDML
ncbi:MAG: hypothetical protein M1821_010067 [Bathelium mastoideum]|nr:MAG: hypothetical protein M1821_010067 [Bathelium mastoideum]